MSSTRTQCRPSTSPTISVPTATLCVSFGAALVDEGEVGVEVAGVLRGELAAAGVRRHDGDRLLDLALQVLGEQRQRGEVVEGEVEEALDLTGVEVDRDDAVGPGGEEQVGEQPGGDRLAALGLPVLAGVAVEGDDGGDPLAPTPASGRRS